jgi:hypothetical protein
MPKKQIAEQKQLVEELGLSSSSSFISEPAKAKQSRANKKGWIASSA